MKAIIVVSVDLPTPDDTVKILEHINPPTIPYFAGDVRIAVGGDAQHVIDWLDG